MVLAKKRLNHFSSSHLFPKITLQTILTCSQRSRCRQFSPVSKDHTADSSHLFPKTTLHTALTCSQRSHCTQFSPVLKDHAADNSHLFSKITLQTILTCSQRSHCRQFSPVPKDHTAHSSHLFPKITLHTVLPCSQRSRCRQFSPVPKDHTADDVGRELGQQRLEGYRVTLTLVYDPHDCTCFVLHALLQRLLAHPEVSQGHESHAPKLFPFWSVAEYHP